MSWMQPVARAAEARLEQAGIQLTLGGEPTVVPLQPQGAEWSVAADGPTKLGMARRLARELQCNALPGSTLLWCPGKRYDGEVNPRWTLRLISGKGGEPPVRWPEPCQPGLSGHPLTPAQVPAFLERLGAQLGLTLQPLSLRDPLDPERQIWAAPLSVDDDEPQPAADHAKIRWLAPAWPLAEELAELSGAPGPAGLRLPLEHLPEEIPRQVLTLELGPDGWELFLPPLLRRPLQTLLQAVADGLDGLAAPRLSGVLPFDGEGHWQVLGLTADPGVLEINLPVCRGWAEYHGWLQLLEQACGRVGLRSWKATADGHQEGTGGGNHLLWGGPSLEQHPFFSRPAWLVGILRYWQHHPALAYLFSGACVGPASQAPRPDEVAGNLLDLELAYRALEAADDGRTHDDPRGDHRSLIGETLRHLHADRSGNNHRSEISFDKFWNPGAPAGCLGLVEFRALESLPHAAWSSAIALLWSALAAHLLNPVHRPAALRAWGAALHDRLLLPSQLWADLEAVLAELAADGLVLDPEPYRAIWEWRFPPLLRWREGELQLELRPALEPWPLICDTPVQGGLTSRFIDASLRRVEVIANGACRSEVEFWLNGRQLPLTAQPLAVRYRHQRLYPCLHPAIEPHLPLELELRTASHRHRFRLEGEGPTFVPVAVEAPVPPGGGTGERRYAEAPDPWRARRHQDASTIDLRLD